MGEMKFLVEKTKKGYCAGSDLLSGFADCKKENIRESWGETFESYANEGEDEMLLPDFLDSETEKLIDE